MGPRHSRRGNADSVPARRGSVRRFNGAAAQSPRKYAITESVFIHVKDARGSADRFEFLLPGEGDIDYVEYFKQVRAAGYRGPVVVEVSSQISNRAGYDSAAAARRSYVPLAEAMKKSGVRRK